VVADHRGRGVPGLAATDFRLLVDGREVPIDYFTEIVAGAAAAPAPAPERQAPATGSTAGVDPAVPAAMAVPDECTRCLASLAAYMPAKRDRG